MNKVLLLSLALLVLVAVATASETQSSSISRSAKAIIRNLRQQISKARSTFNLNKSMLNANKLQMRKSLRKWRTSVRRNNDRITQAKVVIAEKRANIIEYDGLLNQLEKVMSGGSSTVVATGVLAAVKATIQAHDGEMRALIAAKSKSPAEDHAAIAAAKEAENKAKEVKNEFEQKLANAKRDVSNAEHETHTAYVSENKQNQERLQFLKTHATKSLILAKSVIATAKAKLQRLRRGRQTGRTLVKVCKAIKLILARSYRKKLAHYNKQISAMVKVGETARLSLNEYSRQRKVADEIAHHTPAASAHHDVHAPAASAHHDVHAPAASAHPHHQASGAHK